MVEAEVEEVVEAIIANREATTQNDRPLRTQRRQSLY
jgi:hypothetical protein